MHGENRRRDARHRPGLATAFHAVGVGRTADFGKSRFQRRQVVGAGDGVVHETAGQRLARFRVIDAALHQRLTDALRYAPLRLPARQQRINDDAEIVGKRVAVERDLARLPVDLHLRHMAAVGKGVVTGVHCAKAGNAAHFLHYSGQRNAAVGAGDGERAVGGGKLHICLRDLQFLRSMGLHLFDDLIGGDGDRAARHDQRPRPAGAAAQRQRVAVARGEGDRIPVETQIVRKNLRPGGFMALSCRLRADFDQRLAVGGDRHFRVFVRTATCAFHVIDRRPAPDAALRRRRLGAGWKIVVVRRRQRLVDYRVGVEAVELQPAHRCHGHFGRLQQVHPAERHGINPHLARSRFHQSFGAMDHFGPTGAAIGVGRGGVGQRAAHADKNRRYAIDAAQEVP